jgi:hypothetical protein
VIGGGFKCDEDALASFEPLSTCSSCSLLGTLDGRGLFKNKPFESAGLFRKVRLDGRQVG